MSPAILAAIGHTIANINAHPNESVSLGVVADREGEGWHELEWIEMPTWADFSDGTLGRLAMLLDMRAHGAALVRDRAIARTNDDGTLVFAADDVSASFWRQSLAACGLPSS